MEGLSVFSLVNYLKSNPFPLATGGFNGRLSNLHIQIAKSAWKSLKKL